LRKQKWKLIGIILLVSLIVIVPAVWHAGGDDGAGARDGLAAGETGAGGGEGDVASGPDAGTGSGAGAGSAGTGGEMPDLSGIKADFEDGTAQGFVPRIGEEVLQVTDADAHTGTYSLLVTGRANPYSGAKIDTSDNIHRKTRYVISVWVKLAPGEAPAKMRLSLQRNLGSTESYVTIAGDATVTADRWVQLKGVYTHGVLQEDTSVYVETAEGTASFYIDDFELVYDGDKEVQMDIPSLKDVFADAFEIGVAVDRNMDGKFEQLISKHYNVLVAGNAMKPGPLQPAEGRFNWEAADRYVEFAKKHGMAVRFHTLVWHSQAAEWMFRDENGELLKPSEESKKLVLDRLEAHIRAVAERYKDDIRDWDVVNEVIDESQPNGMRRSMWYVLTGTDYIEHAFRVARDALGPDARLYINDYNTHIPKKRDYLYNLVKDMLDKGVPIDGIGHQTHINIEYPPIDQIRESIERFAALGLDNQITELDISIYTNDTDQYEAVPEDVQIKLAHRYRELFDLFLELKDNISAVVFWGTDDGNTWLRSFPITRLNTPLLFDDQLQAKYAFWAVVGDMDKVPPLPEEEPLAADIPKKRMRAAYGTPIIDGKWDAIWDQAEEGVTDVWVMGQAGARAAFRVLWDDGHLYVIAKVTDALLSSKSANPWEQDSLEIFVDQNFGQTPSYEADDGQWRVSFENVQSYNGAASPDNFTTAVSVTEDGYLVEARLSLDPAYIKEGAVIGFDVQVNNDEDGDGVRDSVAIWSDPTGDSYRNTQHLGILELAGR